jgi:NAD(P) transhydrogenase subunit alpha
MIIGIPKELILSDPRAPIVPDTVKSLCKLGAELFIESKCGEKIGFKDKDYEHAGAKILFDRNQLLACSDVIMRIHKPPIEEISLLKKGCIHISFFDPFNDPQLLNSFIGAGVLSISMEMIPRIARAQKMDALSSQASLAGYAAVILAAEKIDRVLPMMMTAAGTISPMKVFVIGVGVAGLQAIATAKRLGARVEAFDTRPIVAEQVESLGAKFVDIDLGDTGETSGGYAKELTDLQIDRQRQGITKVLCESDIVITTAQVFGRPAPLIVTSEMIKMMKSGSFIIDMGIETGGNVEGSVFGKEIITENGVTIIGQGNLQSRVGRDASQMYSSNLRNFITEFWESDNKELKFDFDDEIIKGCVITRDSELVNEIIIKSRK